ncbi:MAG: peptidoglycan-binding protein, partial [Paracoccaceae bacterium]
MKYRRILLRALGAIVAALFWTTPLQAESVAFKQAVAQAASSDKVLSAFYKARNYAPIWMGNRDGQRRRAFLEALKRAPDHGLPAARYDFATIRKGFSGFRSAKVRGATEVAVSKKFLQYARDIQSGILEPRRIDKDMTLRPPRRDPLTLLTKFAASSPAPFIRRLPPQTAEYAALVKEKRRMSQIVARGGWGAKVPAKKLKPGSSGAAVVALRKRLTKLGYRGGGASPAYDNSLEIAVARFQKDYGLIPDGVAGKATLAVVNTSAATRLMQVVIGLERLRWLNKSLGKRHILVNEAAFMARVIDNGR